MIAETNPNHLAMMTGAYGDDSGIPGNAFALYSPLENEDSCQPTGPVDERKPPDAHERGERQLPARRDGLRGDQAAGQPRRRSSPPAIFGKPKLGRHLRRRRRRTTSGRPARPAPTTTPTAAGADQPGDGLRDRRQDRDGRGAAHDPRGRGGAQAPARLHVREPAPGGLAPATRLRRRAGLRRGDRHRPTARSSGSSASCGRAASGSGRCWCCCPTTRWTPRSRRPT